MSRPVKVDSRRQSQTFYSHPSINPSIFHLGFHDHRHSAAPPLASASCSVRSQNFQAGRTSSHLPSPSPFRSLLFILLELIIELSAATINLIKPLLLTRPDRLIRPRTTQYTGRFDHHCIPVISLACPLLHPLSLETPYHSFFRSCLSSEEDHTGRRYNTRPAQTISPRDGPRKGDIQIKQEVSILERTPLVTKATIIILLRSFDGLDLAESPFITSTVCPSTLISFALSTTLAPTLFRSV